MNFAFVVSLSQIFVSRNYTNITIYFEQVECTDGNGDSCHLDVSHEGADLTVTGATDVSELKWTAKLDYGCGVVEVQCSVGEYPA